MKKMLIDDTQPEETRVVIVDGNKVEDVEFESSFRKQIKGNVFLAKVVRIEPSLQAAFVDYGGNRHGFLAFGEIHPDYYNVSDEERAKVAAEVDEIIARKRQYQAEREAERERRRLEREQKRAEYEARKAAEEAAMAEAEARAAESGSEDESEARAAVMPQDVLVEELGLQVAESFMPEYVSDEDEPAKEEALDGCGCPADCACRVEDGHCHCAENGECTCDKGECGGECVCSKAEGEALDGCGCPADCACRVEDGHCHCAENGECTCDKGECGGECVCSKAEDKVADGDAEADAMSEDTAEATVEATVEAMLGDVEAEETRKPRRRRSTRFLGRRPSAKAKFKVSAESAGAGDLAVVSQEDDDEEAVVVSKDFDNDDDDADTDFEHYLEVQRKLIFARKLYHRSTIQNVIKEGQTLLIQIVKEERGNKGAACTTYLSLAGRYCVLMPNRIKSGGVSRKITSAIDRKRLKDIMKELPLCDEMSLIIRTAGEDKKRSEIVRDYNYLIRSWNHIRHTALNGTVPSLVYEEGNLIKRALRDMYTKDISEVIIDGDEAYKTAKEFSKILSPNMGRKIKCRKAGDIPVFQQYQVEKELDKLHNPVVQLNSGGYLVINPTEALVSIDVNSGRATHEKDIEETALKTNLEAADEIAKQLRMRNLAGLVVVDFIDMEEAANNHAVERRMKEAMKPDRARVQIAKMSIFGLLEISRQRMHSSFIESNYTCCPYCKGQGVQRTTESSAALVLRAVEEEGIKGNYNRLEVRLPSDIAVYILNYKRRQLADLEEKYDIEVIVSADPAIKNIADYKLERSRQPKARLEVQQPLCQMTYDEVQDEDESDEDESISAISANENEAEKNERRGSRFDRRRGRLKGNRRRGRPYAENEAEQSGSAEEKVAAQDVPEAAVEPQAPETPKKATWWKKLLG